MIATNAPLPEASLAPVTHATVGTPARRTTIQVQNIHRYFGKLKAVNDVSFTAYAGQVVGFIGPNGAGKTTTMRILATLDVPTQGDAFVCGYSVIDDPDQVRRVMGFMPDHFGRYGSTTVTEYIDFYARAYGLKGAKRKDALDRVMSFTELDRLPQKPIDSLSKGLAQRLGLARTLIHDPEVLILDEPAAGLDPRARVELRELILLLSTELNKTILISSHILTELGELCDSACIVEAGRVLASGTVAELQARQTQSAAEVGKPIQIRVMQGASLVERWLLEQPLITRAVASGDQNLLVGFEGTDAERAALLAGLIGQGFPVVEFQSKPQTLEDAFMAITKGVMQ